MALRLLNQSCCSSSASTSYSSSSVQSTFRLAFLLWQRRRSFATNSPRDLYQVLGVKKTAEQDEIKKAFYTLSKRYHPDAIGSSEASTKKFLEIKHAYDRLKDEQKRRIYDLRQQRKGTTYSGQSEEFNRQWEAEMDRMRKIFEENMRAIWHLIYFFYVCLFILYWKIGI